MARESSASDFRTAVEIARRVRSGEVSASTIVEECLDQIQRFQPKLNAFVTVCADEARAQAAEIDGARAAGKPLGPLAGVPVSVKDILLQRGGPTFRGSWTVREEGQAWDEDAPSVARLREHGAVFLGKTTTPEFGWKGVTDSALTGITRNPWNPALTPGGSSGGAAVAAALGMGCLHLGTDGGGSVRIPASFTGIFGHKPTFGLVPAYPLSPFGTVAHLGPMTRSVADAAMMLNVLARPDHRDWHSLPYLATDFTQGLEDGVTGLRIALSKTLGHAAVDPEVERLVREAAAVLADLGAVVEEQDPGIGDTRAVFEAHWFTGAANLVSRLAPEQQELLEPGLRRIAERGAQIAHMDYVAAIDKRGALGLQMAEFHQHWDVLLTPSVAIPAFEAGRVAPEGTDQANWTHWTPFSFPFNLTQQPAASMPCGFTRGGLPVGLQIVAAKYRDDLVLRVARAYERENPIVLPEPKEVAPQ
jgi:aspartyl-tRNA(Asn)/glutamyl-tRNA(Gln) amidotransferase subunit A